MPAHPHHEHHFTATDAVRDVVIGMSDGLTVPFALAAGLTGAVAASKLVVTAGLAEIAAGAIAMGLGGYLAARHLIDRGCRRVAWLGAIHDTCISRERFAGALAALQAAGLDLPAERQFDASGDRQLDAAAEQLLDFAS